MMQALEEELAGARRVAISILRHGDYPKFKSYMLSKTPRQIEIGEPHTVHILYGEALGFIDFFARIENMSEANAKKNVPEEE